MFLALRDLRFARGRFGLMGAVIALITLLVVLLSGLTAGLADESVSAVRSLPVDRLAFSAPTEGESIAFTSSRLDVDQLRQVAAEPGVDSVTPLGVAPTRLGTGGRELPVTAFGAQPGDSLAPAELSESGVVVSAALAEDAGLALGDSVAVGGRDWTVTGTVTSASFNHTPVVWLPIEAWRHLDAAGGAYATVAGVRLQAGAQPATPGDQTVLVSPGDALAAVGSYSAENGSLTLMRVLLLVVSALVVGSFFTVWTIQRMPDLAVLKAIGAGTGYLLRDAAVQALVVLAVGGALGTGVAAVAGAAAARAVPFVLSPATTVLPTAALVAVGMVGALAAVRRITTVDPLTALGASR